MSADFFDPVLAEDLTWTGSRSSLVGHPRAKNIFKDLKWDFWNKRQNQRRKAAEENAPSNPFFIVQ